MEIVEPTTANRLQAHGIKTVNALLERCQNEEAQRALAQDIGLSSRRVAQWVRRADLARIDGIGGEYVTLVEAVGVQSVADLATRDPQQLQDMMRSINKRKRLVKRVPAIGYVKKWVETAASLPRLNHTRMV